MYSSEFAYNWDGHSAVKRNIVAFAVALAILFMLLMIPVHINFKSSQQAVQIEVELSKIVPEITPKKKKEQKPEEKNLPIKKSQTKVTRVKAKNVIPKRVKQNPQITIEKTIQLPSSQIIINTFKNRKKYKYIDKDFQARTSTDDEFKFKTIEQPKWNQVTKLIDEDQDKPRTSMRYKVDSNLVTTIKLIQKLTGGLHKNSERQYIDCDLEVQDAPDWQCL